MTVLEATDLSKWYGDVIAVNDLTVSVAPGVTGLLGPNGAGKSTLMRMAMGLNAPSAGTITVLGENPWDNSALLARIGYVPEADAPWRDMTGRAVAIHAARLSGMTPGDAASAVDHVLPQVGLVDAQDRRVAGYSRGMRQRLKLALSLLHDPQLLILDEPLLGVDPITRRDLIVLIKNLAASGKSVLLSTHVLQDVEAMTQRIMLMNHGRLLAHGEVSEIRDLLERFPRTIRVATTDARRLGSDLWSWPSVLTLQAEEGALIVKTKDPQGFFTDLQAYLLKGDVPFTSVTTLDDNVEAIFRYLVGE